MRDHTAVTTGTRTIGFQRDDYVLYRDPERFWKGVGGHTFVCRVTDLVAHPGGETRYELSRLEGGVITNARGRYMRLLPPADTMRDIDTAPLHTTGAAADMTAAAIAWLTQQHTTTNRRPELPPQHD